MGAQMVRVGLLGPLVIEVDGVAVEMRAARERSLLARLACDAGTTCGDDVLVDHLWGDEPPASARSTLQTYVSHLRRALAPAAIERDGAGYRLSGVRVDLDEFQEELDLAFAAADPATRLAGLERALARWRGRPLEDLGDRIEAVARRTALDERRNLAVEERAAARLELGEHAAVVADLERHVAEHPLRERGTTLLVLALYRSGRQADALAAAQRLRTTLRDELGLDPGPALRALEQRILEQDPTLLLVDAVAVARIVATPPTASPTLVSVADKTDKTGLTAEADEPAEVAAPPVPLPARLVAGRADQALVGRRHELDLLLGRAESSAVGAVPPLVVLRGEAGIGKTRLARELLLVVAGRGETALWGRCPPDRTGSFEPWAEALDHLVRHRPDVVVGWEAVLAPLLPALAAGGSDPLLLLRTGAEKRFTLFEAATDVLARAAATTPVVVVVDDLQWADPASLALLEHVIARRIPRLLVVATVRRPDRAATAAADEVLVRLMRDGWLDVCELSGLSTSELRVLLDRATGGAAAEAEVTTLHAHTDGNPFFVTEVLAALGDDAARLLATGDVPFTAGVEAVLGQRLDQLGAADESVLAAGAVLGDEFGLADVAACAAISEDEVLRSLERAVAMGMVEEGATVGSFAFPHALVRTAVARRTSGARHRKLGASADALRAERDAVDPDALGRRIAGRALGRQARREDAADAAGDDRLVQSRELLTRIAAGTSGVTARPARDPVAAFPLTSARAGRSVLALAQAMVRRGEREIPRHRALECAALARRLEDPVLLTEAALTLALAEGLRPGPCEPASDELRALLGEAQRTLPDGEATVVLRARVLTSLASAQTPSVDDAARDLFSAGAVVAAERSGDPRVCAAAYLARRRARRGPDGLDERLALAERAVTAAAQAGARTLGVLAAGARATDLLSAGRVAEVDESAMHEVRHEDAAGLTWSVQELFGAGVGLFRGDVREAVAGVEQASSSELVDAGSTLAPDDPFATLLLALSIEQGTLARSRGSIAAASDRWPLALLWHGARAAAELAAGAHDEARAVLDRIATAGLDRHHRDGTHLAGLALTAEAAVRVDHPLAGPSGELLATYTDRLVVAGAAAVLDPRERYVGLAQAVAGRGAEAWATLCRAGELAIATGGIPAQQRLAADLDALAERLGHEPTPRPVLAAGLSASTSPLDRSTRPR